MALLRTHLISQTQRGGELQRLTHRGELVVQIHLLAIRRETREGLLLNLVPVEGDGPFAHTAGFATGDQGRLFHVFTHVFAPL